MATRQIVLKARITQVAPEMSHRLQAWVDTYDNADPRIFVWQRGPSVPGLPEPNDFFVNVASAADMEEYPPGEPLPGSSSSSSSSSSSWSPPSDMPFFRLSRLDLLFRSVYDLTRSWNLIQSDVRLLLTNLKRLEAIGTDVTIDITV